MDALLAAPALASEGEYQPLAGLAALKSVGGVAYGALVITYFVTLWRRRAKRASSGQRDRRWRPMNLELPDGAQLLDPKQKEEEVTPLASAIVALQASGLCVAMFYLSRSVDAFFLNQAVPDQVIAQKVSQVVATGVRCCAYLATFLVGANAVGLAGLTVQLLLFGPQEDEGAAKGGAPGGPSLPKVSVVDDIGAIRRAFAEAEEQGRGERP
ncbi:hypothetical protein ACKKBG_A37605 [Auxenochlorella protothecoides x Auxenochlorella symbiontica]